MPVPWTGDGGPADHLRVEHNLAGLLRDLQRDAPLRVVPTIELARGWHRRVFEGLTAPVPYYIGGVRDSDPSEPELHGYEVNVPGPNGPVAGVASADVWTQLAQFQTTAQAQAARLDALFAYDPARRFNPPEQVLGYCATLLGEWVRIHPFVNGNGRTARIWANWGALRYGLPAFIRLRPRPAGDTYVDASDRSMRGDHRYMKVEMWRMLASYIEHREPG